MPTLPADTAVRDPASDADFGTGWLAYWLTKEVNLDQLLDEFRQALGEPETYQITSAAYGTTATASVDDPVHFYWRPDTGSTPDPNLFITVVNAHTPDWNWQPGVPTLDQVKAKAAAGQTLGAADIQVALVALLTASNS